MYIYKEHCVKEHWQVFLFIFENIFDGLIEITLIENIKAHFKSKTEALNSIMLINNAWIRKIGPYMLNNYQSVRFNVQT